MYMDYEDIIKELARKKIEEQSLRNKVLLGNAMEILKELKSREK